MSNEITSPTGTEPVADRPVVSPAVDVYENQEELLIVADLPGVTTDSLSVDLEEDRLTIVGRRKALCTEDTPVLMGGGRAFDFKRVFTVPDAIDADKISAELKSGVLQLHLPRHERAKPRRIAIRSAS
ncbi:MAG: heat-shock protein [Deltaproteobacteria bacterium HGW-Deltaproteobacteria-14]|jgi:HSP20 family molecular chaperone IbpA|nr:MAG: heat-shock protein [Deltaproteobacteria bacterium HGW-Deltaproteobacteria-14]